MKKILSIGSKVKELRLKNNISQKDLCGNYLNRVILSKIENGKMLPSIPQLIYISKKFGKPLNYFLSDFDTEDTLDKNTDTEKSNFETLFIQEHFYDIVKNYEYNTCTFSNSFDITKYYYVGMSYFNLYIYYEALKHLKKYFSLYTKSDSDVQEKQILLILNALNTLFKIMLKNKNYQKGKSYLLIAKKYIYLYNVSDTLISFIIHNNLAYVYLYNEEFNSTINLLNTFLNNHQNLQYVKIMPDMYISLNIAYYNIGDYEKSIMFIKKAISMYLCQENYIEAGECYLNYINALRYSKRFTDALEVVEKCKKDYISDETLYNRLLLQEIIIYFNLYDYDKILSKAYDINLKVLPKISKCNYYFMLGITEVIKQNYKAAHNYLFKCQKKFTSENYTYDLAVLYEALYIITGDTEYKIRTDMYHNIIGRKNIVIESECKFKWDL